MLFRSQKFLLLAVVGLVPIALMYGLAPTVSLPFLFGIDATSTNVRHIFRAVMGLYLALAIYWLIGAFGSRQIARSALQSLIVFMWGLAAGRAISMAVDGIPNTLLIVYILLEIAFGTVGLVLLKRDEVKTEPIG